MYMLGFKQNKRQKIHEIGRSEAKTERVDDLEGKK